jgi:hypothetical protein
MCGRRFSKKRKSSLILAADFNPPLEPSEPDYLAQFLPHPTNVNLDTGLTTRPIPGIEHQIISTIKTIRN